MEIKKIVVIGAGTMGNGIAQVCAQSGRNVLLIDKDSNIIKKALATISNNLDRLIKKQLLTEQEKDTTLKNICFGSIEDISEDTDLIIEAIVENKDSKISLYKELSTIIKNSQSIILASNTSSISITELAAYWDPENFIGMHFMNPVPVMKLVELIRGFSTSNNTTVLIKEFVNTLNKIPIEVNDYPGFISNRILMPMINEAIFSLYENVAKAEDIDNIMKLGMNHPMGPLTLADFIGLDVCLNIMEVLYLGFNDSKYRPCPLLKKMVAANKLGRKTGEGFYKY